MTRTGEGGDPANRSAKVVARGARGTRLTRAAGFASMFEKSIPNDDANDDSISALFCRPQPIEDGDGAKRWV